MKHTPDTDFLREFLEETEGGPPDPVEGTNKAMSHLDETKQASRWWPFPVLYGKARTAARPPTITDTTEYQPSPISATDGHEPTVIGRTQSMLSPAKAITAGALVFAIGGVMLIAQPFQQQSSVPGAAIDAEPIWVTGSIRLAPTCTGATLATPAPEGVRQERGYLCQPQTWTISDPRLSGTAASTWNADVYTLDEGVKAVITEAFYVTNEDGGWACRSNGIQRGGGGYGPAQEWDTGETLMCVGEGEYAGLSAILAIGTPEGPDVVGMIFPGDAPPLPERPTAE